ncbi:hypothetical protein M409DRAFT_54050 [Zasmidium cellare ATCC 36951]|uniref:Chromo domain-containing protein n=1 Tax=Zasmidium cellare ATCC 36951 TaxID=1080233 RepID=A0A6A6CNF8_ZASCE|nr:uncharacterized protein M409DRAFT_54050 [Zasmidium cellare ATCC 36951]KAF2167452.1 hypothetical protein M409DRAFT_54050 [Zasmidium cellare ATCC 36951]
MATSQSSAASDEPLASTSHSRSCKVNDKQYTITADTRVFKNDDFTCCTDYETDLYIQEAGGQRLKLGTVLNLPADYEGDVRVHASKKDKLTDTQKIFQLLFDRTSQKPKERFDEDFRNLLNSKNLHFIAFFCLEPELRRKGLAKEAMLTYLDGIDQMGGEYGYQGVVFLSPGPITDETDKMKDAGQKVKSFVETVADLMLSYSKAGYESLFEEYKDLHGGITIMIRTTSQVDQDDDGDVEMSDVEEGASRQGSVPRPAVTRRSEDLSIVVEALSGEESELVRQTLAAAEEEEELLVYNADAIEHDSTSAAIVAETSETNPIPTTSSRAINSPPPLPQPPRRSTRRAQQRSNDPRDGTRRGISDREIANLEEYIDNPDPRTGVFEHDNYVMYRWRGRWYLLERDTPEEWTAGAMLRRFTAGRLVWEGNEAETVSEVNILSLQRHVSPGCFVSAKISTSLPAHIELGSSCFEEYPSATPVVVLPSKNQTSTRRMAIRKRTATTAGLEPGPSDPPQTRRTTQIGSAQVVEHHTIQGEDCRITVDVTSTQHRQDPPCVKTIHAAFSLRRPKKPIVQLGFLEGEIVDKSYKEMDCDTAAWLKLLTPPTDYDGNLKTFAIEGDKVTDFQKALIALHTQKGELRSDFAHIKDQFSSDKINYICHFELKPAFHGGGFSQIVMAGYLTALGKLDHGHGFEGIVLLSPAGIVSATVAKEKIAKRALDWFEIVEMLIAFYTRCGYETILRAKKDLKKGMSITGQIIPRPTAGLPTSTIFPPRPKKTKSEAEVDALKIEIPDKSLTTAAADKSYLWHGRYYARTPDTDPAWIAEGQRGPRRVQHTHGLIDPTKEYTVRAIVAETTTHYLIKWEDDAATGESYDDTWEPMGNANAAAVADWEAGKSEVVVGDDDGESAGEL